jgi:cell division protein FtsI (penicillin-binding protein 3)
VPGERVIDERASRELIHMLESVVTPAGTGLRAAIPGYRVAGKTGTAWKSSAGGYSTDRYLAVFGGVAPATNPRLAAVVIIDEPRAGLYYGGDVAAPVFSSVVGGALRLLAVAPDTPVGTPAEQMAPGSAPAPDADEALPPGPPAMAVPDDTATAAAPARTGAASTVRR